MPPLFGIIRPDLQSPDQIKTSRMAGSAKYVVPRTLIQQNHPGIWMAAALTGKDRGGVPKVFSKKGSLVIAADASLYNQHELHHRLGIDPNGGDTGEAGLILRAYEKWGSRCLEFLYGDFAFVIFNTESGEIFCGRDQMGVRPLFYTYREGTFLFSSELRMMTCVEDDRPGLNESFLLDTLVGVKSPREKSPFEDIYRLPPAHYLVCKKREIQTTRYWMPDAQATIDLAGEEDYIDMFRELLVNAVNMRCRGVDSLGSELSGGLDSSAVTGIAAAQAVENNIPFTAFSNVFPLHSGLDFKDERDFIGDMIRFKNLNGEYIDRLGIGINELLQYTLDIQGTFIQQNFNIFNYGLYKVAGEKGVTTLLSGFGGDELVSARTSVQWNELIKKRQWKIIRDEIYCHGITPRSVLKPGLIATRYLLSRLFRPKYRTGIFTPELLRKRLNNLPLKPAFVQKHLLEQRFRDKYRTPVQENLSSRQLFRISMDHLPQRMEYCYMAAAQFGIEYRYPLLDVNLILACLAFPPWVKQHHGENRYLFRQAIAGFVPESIRQRDDKSGSTIPHTYFSLVNEKEEILGMIRDAAEIPFLKELFDFSRFPSWYEKLVKREDRDMKYLNNGTFYTYLMMMKHYGTLV
jgi:asparagine synthase (glutamine-hydrolysing)